MLNLQANYSLLTITHEGELYLSRVIDVGYEDLETIPSPQAGPNGLSLAEPSSDQDNSISKIVLEIQRSLDYYESHYGKPSISNLILAPLENELSSLMSALKDDLGVTVRSLDITEILETDTELTTELQAKCFNAIGAALRQAVESLADRNPE